MSKTLISGEELRSRYPNFANDADPSKNYTDRDLKALGQVQAFVSNDAFELGNRADEIVRHHPEDNRLDPSEVAGLREPEIAATLIADTDLDEPAMVPDVLRPLEWPDLPTKEVEAPELPRLQLEDVVALEHELPAAFVVPTSVIIGPLPSIEISAIEDRAIRIAAKRAEQVLDHDSNTNTLSIIDIRDALSKPGYADRFTKSKDPPADDKTLFGGLEQRINATFANSDNPEMLADAYREAGYRVIRARRGDVPADATVTMDDIQWARDHVRSNELNPDQLHDLRMASPLLNQLQAAIDARVNAALEVPADMTVKATIKTPETTSEELLAYGPDGQQTKIDFRKTESWQASSPYGSRVVRRSQLRPIRATRTGAVFVSCPGDDHRMILVNGKREEPLSNPGRPTFGLPATFTEFRVELYKDRQRLLDASFDVVGKRIGQSSTVDMTFLRSIADVKRPDGSDSDIKRWIPKNPLGLPAGIYKLGSSGKTLRIYEGGFVRSMVSADGKERFLASDPAAEDKRCGIYTNRRAPEVEVYLGNDGKVRVRDRDGEVSIDPRRDRTH